MKDFILKALAEMQNGYSLCGFVDRKARIYPLGSDTKVISTLFEIVARGAVAAYANSEGLSVAEPSKQNHYPDFTLMRNEADGEKIAIDVKTTYFKGDRPKFQYTLGSYTSYIHKGMERKNIVFPYGQYKKHWIIGFVYNRIDDNRGADRRVYSFNTLKEIPIPFDDVKVFMQEKWRIAGDRAGSGNTANIGSITGTLAEFGAGKGVFVSESEFLEYWRGYKRSGQERRASYSNIQEFRSRRVGGSEN